MLEHSTTILKRAICPILGVSFDEALGRSSLSERAREQAVVGITSSDFVALWTAIVELAGSDFDPLELGQKIAKGPLLPILLACSCAPNLLVALERVARYKTLFGPIAMLNSKSRRGLRVELMADPDRIEVPTGLAIVMIVLILQKARDHSGRHIVPIAASLPVHRFDRAGIDAYLGCRHSESSVAMLEFAEADTRTPFLSENEELWQDVRQELELRLDQHNSNRPFHSRVDAVIRKQLYTGSAHAEAVCDALGVSRSTMQRRLKEEGHTFQGLLNKVRFDLATRYLRKSNMGMDEIAGMIGFLDTKSFYRAFRRQFGTTPQRYRSHQA